MNGFVIKSNLPHRVDKLIIGEKYAGKLEKSLKLCGISPIFVPENPFVDERLSGHADLSVFHAGGERLFLAKYLKGTSFAAELSDLGAKLSFSEKEQGKKYPEDVGLNICALNNKAFYCSKSAEETVLEYLSAVDIIFLNLKQGYAKCSILVVDENSIITADAGVERIAREQRIDVLMIDQGYISLTGYNYGFIGGAGFKISSSALAFTGILDKHPDAWRIEGFLLERGVKPVYLTNEEIFDIGGAVPIIEKID